MGAWVVSRPNNEVVVLFGDKHWHKSRERNALIGWLEKSSLVIKCSYFRVSSVAVFRRAH